ncbi:MAG: Asp-tRNA(Asn)/Glu-tRNA(Gln) amidotransferase subunit GatC [bacterium]
MPQIEFDIDHISKLALIDLNDSERAELPDQLGSIVSYVSKLHEVDTSKVDMKAYLTDQVNVFRADEVTGCSEGVREACREAFPKSTGGALEVPAVFDMPDESH